LGPALLSGDMQANRNQGEKTASKAMQMQNLID
jgi:hypothetical protein